MNKLHLSDVVELENPLRMHKISLVNNATKIALAKWFRLRCTWMCSSVHGCATVYVGV